MDKALYGKLPAGKFVNLPPGRSEAMRAVKGRDNKSTERRLRLALVRAGVRGWKVQPKGLPAKADFFFPHANLIVFIDGCFWHGCPACTISIPRTNTEYWRTKLQINRARDARVTRQLVLQGFVVKRFWEHEVPQCIKELIGLLGNGA
ncbi:MAG: very short patch repair endonuclease [Terriglobia bacterium]